MSNYMIQGETLTGIADAIRTKTGSTEEIAVSEMAGKIEGLSTGFPNGTEWVEAEYNSSTPFDTSSRGFVYGNGVWVGGKYDDSLTYSVDGKSWFPVTGIEKDSSGSIETLAYGSGVFILSGISGGVWLSYDGINWKPTNITEPDYFKVACFGGGIWCAVSGSKQMYYSHDGEEWILNENGLTDVYCTGISYYNGLFMACTNNKSSGLYWSSDGVSWTPWNYPGNAVSAVYYYDGLWVASGSSKFYYSVDGKTWTTGTDLSSSIYVTHILCVDGHWVAASGYGYNSETTYLFYSTDGKNWSSCLTEGDSIAFSHVYYANGVWVVGGNKNILCSNDGINWRICDSTGNGYVHMAKGIWVARFYSNKPRYSVAWEPGI